MSKEVKFEPTSSLIGRALVEGAVISQEELERALKIQEFLEQPKQLGEVLVELGFATRQSIYEAIAAHGKSMRLGELLVEQGLITLESLEIALKIQKESRQPLGEVLIEQGLITERMLLNNIAHQAQVPYIEPSFSMIEPSIFRGVSPDYLARHGFVPFSTGEDGTVTFVVSDLNSKDTVAAIEEVYREDYKLALGPADYVQETIRDYRDMRANGRKPTAEVRVQDENSVVQLVNHIFGQAIDERASDIHIEPTSDSIRLRYRVDGALVFRTDLPIDLLTKINSRIKIMAECDIAERSRHQGGRILFRKDGQEYDMRLSCYVTVHGECLVIRVLNKQMGLVSLDELGMNPTMLDRYRSDVLDLPTGVVLITGPTGSGKTTTLYSSLDYSNKIDRKIITVEDPVEFMVDGLIQCSIGSKIGRSFESSLREIVRQDPDIIVIGEIRDRATAETAIQAALTGHKVYTTFHTEDTIGGLMRLLNMEIEAFLISSTVISVVAQRLLRRVCQDCAEAYLPTPVEAARMGLDLAEIRQYEYTVGRGCKTCAYTGYKGRVAVYELLIVNSAVQEAILERKTARQIRQISTETSGLVSMREDGVAKVIRGLTTFQEVLHHTPKTAVMRGINEILSLSG